MDTHADGQSGAPVGRPSHGRYRTRCHRQGHRSLTGDRPMNTKTVQHTPGPWEVVIEREGRSVWVKGIRAANGEWIVRDGWPDDFGHSEFPDARLIASAPDLL